MAGSRIASALAVAYTRGPLRHLPNRRTNKQRRREMSIRKTGAGPKIDYKCFEDLIKLLQTSGNTATAQRLDHLLHRVGWTTGSELIGELGLAILDFQATVSDDSPELQCAISRCMIMVKRIWPDIRLNR